MAPASTWWAGCADGASLTIEATLRDAARFGVARAVQGRLGDGGRLDGFGHALCPDGDPRATALLDLLAGTDPPGDRLGTVVDVLAAVQAQARRRPTSTPPSRPSRSAPTCRRGREAIFAAGPHGGLDRPRLEQFDQPTFMRAQVDYVGPTPPRARR
ncbi:MAG: citrate/2-methylcitrate synthase [Acidimicrobiales bacterium]